MLRFDLIGKVMPRYFLAVVTALTLISVAGLACTRRPAIPKPKELVDVNLLKFETPDLQERLGIFDTAARKFADDGFAHQPYYELGTFVPAVWAKGIDFSEPCTFRGSLESLQDIHRISVEAIVAPLPRVRGILLRVETVGHDSDTWCINFFYCEATNQNVVTPGWSITFFRWNPAHYGRIPFMPLEEAREKITLPLRSYTIRDSEVKIQTDLSIKDDFVRHVHSAGRMRDEYLADLDRLEKLGVKFIQEHKAKKKVYDKVVGHGIFPVYHSEPAPPSHLEPLSEQEEMAELVKAKKYFTEQKKLMREYHEALYAAFRKSFPVDQCWSELGEK